MNIPDSAPDWAEQLRTAVRGDPFWESYLAPLFSKDCPPFSLHLAIFIEPFLGYVLNGKKTVESRFSSRRLAPYEAAADGDVLLLKRSSGPIVGLCRVTHTWFYRLDPASWHLIRTEFAQALCAQDSSFWQAREAASFASLLRIDRIMGVEPINFRKRDRRGWVVLQKRANKLAFEDVAV